MRWRFSDYSLIFLILLPVLVAKLIPRQLLFSHPDYFQPKLSPDGKFVAFIKEDQNNITNVFVRCLCCNVTRQVTFETNDDVLGKFVMFPISSPRLQITLFQPEKGEIGGVFWNFTEKSPLAVYHKHEWYVLNESALQDMQVIVDYNPTASPYIVSYSLDQELILLAYDSAEKPFNVYLYRRESKSIELLFSTKPGLEPYHFNIISLQHFNMVGFTFNARDGLPIQAYLSLPPDTPLLSSAQASLDNGDYADLGIIPAAPQKMVTMVHGGPQSRDMYGFNGVNAWLTNRGYAVLQVNFRGSSGFGKNFINAGHGEWGRKMHYDILDAVEFAVQHGIANKSGSYGGYEVLVALTTSPDVFACGVDIVGPSNLITLLETMPPYWEGYRKNMELRVGADPSTMEGRRFLESRSPLFFAEQVVKPILIMQGANDPRVKQQESDQFVAALKRNGIPVTYVLFPDEGHGFPHSQEHNVLAQYGFIEEFLHNCLHGRYEPFRVGQYGSSAIVISKGSALSSSHPDEIRIDRTFLTFGLPVFTPLLVKPSVRQKFVPRRVTPTSNRVKVFCSSGC